MNSLLQAKAIDRLVEGKMLGVEQEKFDIDYRRMSRPTALSVNFGKKELHGMDPE